jgi:hypothetical protein
MEQNKDITERLRWCGCCDSHEGADEIDALREERDKLRAERDEARRMYCGRVSRDVQPDAFEIAKNHGWDCFKEVAE